MPCENAFAIKMKWWCLCYGCYSNCHCLYIHVCDMNNWNWNGNERCTSIPNFVRFRALNLLSSSSESSSSFSSIPSSFFISCHYNAAASFSARQKFSLYPHDLFLLIVRKDEKETEVEIEKATKSACQRNLTKQDGLWYSTSIHVCALAHCEMSVREIVVLARRVHMHVRMCIWEMVWRFSAVKSLLIVFFFVLLAAASLLSIFNRLWR